MSATAKLFSGAARGDVVDSDLVSIYRRREKLEKVSAYVPAETKLRLARLAKAWTVLSRVEDPKAAEWSESEAAKRLIEAGLDGAFSELGIDGSAKSDEDWSRIEAQLSKRVKSIK